MTPTKFLESRFVSSQIEMDRRKNTEGLAENHAIRAWMWVCLKAATIYFIITSLAQYMSVLFHLSPRPSAAQVLMDEYQAEKRRDSDIAAKMAREAMSVVHEPKGISS